MDQPARGSDRDFCSAHPDGGHSYASHNITENTLTYRLGVWYRVCQSCRYVDLSELADIVDKLIRDRDWEYRRANEAARLSAEARDQADDLRQRIGRLQEHIEIVESDRTANDAWAVKLALEVGISYEQGGDPYQAIARYVRSLAITPETRTVVDSTVREWEQNRDQMRGDPGNG